MESRFGRIFTMADVQPLRGIRYAKEAVSDLAQVVTPPFDVISQEAQQRYYARNPYNMIRLELGQEGPGDTTLNNRYTRAAATVAEWRLSGILRQEATSCYYAYQQVFMHDSKTYTRTSLLARVRLEEWDRRVVLPHEETHSRAKDDRLKLLQACATNFSPIMGLYDDPQGQMRGLSLGSPEVQITDEVNEEHRLYAITDAKQLALIKDFFAGRQLYIADGHHRYETALNYRNQTRELRHGLDANDAVNFALMGLIDLDDPGLLVLPTHRLLFGISDNALHSLSSTRFAEYFTVRAWGKADLTGASRTTILLQMQQELAQASTQNPSLVVSTTEQAWLLSLNEQGRQRMAASGHSAAWNELDLAVAYMLVLEGLLELSTEDTTAETHIRYTDDAQRALQAVQAGEAQIALLFHATRAKQVSAVAKANDRMPHKSTYFYPKLSTGFVLNPLW